MVVDDTYITETDAMLTAFNKVSPVQFSSDEHESQPAMLLVGHVNFNVRFLLDQKRNYRGRHFESPKAKEVAVAA